MISDSQASRRNAINLARHRALRRLRAEQEPRYQELLTEELAAAGMERQREGRRSRAASLPPIVEVHPPVESPPVAE